MPSAHHTDTPLDPRIQLCHQSRYSLGKMSSVVGAVREAESARAGNDFDSMESEVRVVCSDENHERPASAIARYVKNIWSVLEIIQERGWANLHFGILLVKCPPEISPFFWKSEDDTDSSKTSSL